MRTGTKKKKKILQKYRKFEVSCWLVMSNQGGMEIWRFGQGLERGQGVSFGAGEFEL